jgi:hypothetical protein
MNLAGDGLMLVIAPHELGVRERVYLNASTENSPTSGAVLAPQPRQNPKKRAALRSFAGSTNIDSVASSQGWLTQKRSAGQNHRPARRTFPSCTRRAGLLATKSLVPRRLAGAAETRTPQVIEAPAFLGRPREEFSTARLQTGLRPVDAPFHETSVTGLRPVGQDCSAATLGPPANAALSSSALDSLGNARALLPRSPRRRARPRRWAPARRCSLALHRSRLPPMPSTRMAPRSALRRPEPRPARRTVPSCTRRAGLLASGTRPALARRFPRCRACSRWTTPSHGATIAPPTHRGARMGEYITSSSVERARRDCFHGTVLSLCSRTSTDALATSQQGLAPDPRYARAGEAQVVGWAGDVTRLAGDE